MLSLKHSMADGKEGFVSVETVLRLNVSTGCLESYNGDCGLVFMLRGSQ